MITLEICFISLILLTIGNIGFINADTVNESEDNWSAIIDIDTHESCIAFDVFQTSTDDYVITGEAKSLENGEEDLLFIKTNEYGDVTINETYGGNDTDVGWSIQETNDHGYIIVGYTESYGKGSADGWIIKMDSEGYEEWNTTVGDFKKDIFYDVDQTVDNGYIIVGETNSFGHGKDDVWLIKINEDGIVEWNQTYGGNEDDIAYSVQRTSDNGFIIAGYTQSFGVGWQDIFVIKTDEYGIKEWDQTIGGINLDIAWEIQQTNEEGYIVTGYTESFNVDHQDVILINLDSQGNQLWKKTFGGPYNDRAYSIKQTTDDGFIICGTKSVMESSNWHYDVWIIKTNSKGDKQWTRTFGGNKDDIGRSIQQTTDEEYIATGYTHLLSYEGKPNVYLIKISNQNQPPNKPLIPIGKTKGKTGITYQYKSQTTLDNGDQLWYKWSFDDETMSEWLGPYESNEICEVSHSWNTEGEYLVKVKARNEKFAESVWSDSLTVNITATKAWLFGIINNKTVQSNYVEFETKSIFYLSTNPFEMKIYNKGVHFSIQKLNGIITNSYVAGKFNILEIS